MNTESSKPLAHARYVTPAKIREGEILGAAYDESLQLCRESQRYFSKSTYYQHVDPLVITQAELLGLEIEEISGRILYLGHVFNAYGHFLLETLPMISYLFDDAFVGWKYLFLPFDGKPWPVLDRVLDLLQLGQKKSQIWVHHKPTILKASFAIAPRPIEINSRLVDVAPYKTVIRKLKQCQAVRACRAEIDCSSKIFLQRRADRANPAYIASVEGTMAKLGFTLIRPEGYSLSEQIALVAKAKVIAGFAGSSLHNAIFATAGTKVVEFGDSRNSSRSLPNQKIVVEIAGAELHFIPYKSEGVAEKIAKILH